MHKNQMKELLSIQIDDYKYELTESNSMDPSSKISNIYALVSWVGSPYDAVKGSRKVPKDALRDNNILSNPHRRVLGSFDYHYSPESLKTGLLNIMNCMLDEIKGSTEKLINEFEEIYLVRVMIEFYMGDELECSDLFHFYSGSEKINSPIRVKLINELSNYFPSIINELIETHSELNEKIDELYEKGSVRFHNDGSKSLKILKTKVSDLEIIG